MTLAVGFSKLQPKRYEQMGIEKSFVQDKSHIRENVLRGLHFQYPNLRAN